jgi:ABC-2 type transport system permease protein
MLNINWYGTYTLTKREIMRFLAVYHQTIIAPVVSAMIFLSVFHLAIGNSVHYIGNIRFTDFMGYGLIIMTILQNSFANSSSSLIMSKILGYISDLIFTPFSGFELVIAYALGAVARGVTVGLFAFLCLYPFVNFTVHDPILLIFFVLSSSVFLGLVGILSSIFAKNFDQSSAITSYIISPLSFLSGTFYSVKNLPEVLQHINLVNPFFYMIDGFRYSLTSHADSNINIGVIIITVGNILLFFISSFLLSKGIGIKE